MYTKYVLPSKSTMDTRELKDVEAQKYLTDVDMKNAPIGHNHF